MEGRGKKQNLKEKKENIFRCFYQLFLKMINVNDTPYESNRLCLAVIPDL